MSSIEDFKNIFDVDCNRPPVICVEMSGNHQGRLDTALDFARAAKAAGADLLKIQVYRPDTITIRSNNTDFRLSSDNDWAKFGTLYDLYEDAHTPWNWIPEIFKEANKLELPIFASPFDLTAVEFLEELGCPIYKIASPEITDLGLIEACAKTNKPIVISTGLASKEDLDRAVEVLRRHNTPLIILKCVSAYPTPIEDMNVSTISWLRDTYGCAAGLSDHTIGFEACYAATAQSAVMIEKHFRLPGDTTSVDAAFSMEMDKLPALKKSLNKIFSAMGNPTLELPDIAKPSLSGRRSLYVVADVRTGEKFTSKNLRSIRPCYGLEPRHLLSILGRRATCDILAGSRMKWNLVEGGEID